jgi:hypothetical protein
MVPAHPPVKREKIINGTKSNKIKESINNKPKMAGQK